MATLVLKLDTGPTIGALRDLQRKARRDPKFAGQLCGQITGMRFELVARGDTYILMPGAIARKLLSIARAHRRSGRV